MGSISANPTSLIDGEDLVDLLQGHGIGVRRQEVELLEIEDQTFTSFDDEESSCIDARPN